MNQVADISRFLEQFAPSQLAESWDNTGLLIGDASAPVERVMTCLTLSTATVAEALDAQAELVVAHHPLPFKPLKRIITVDPVGRLLLQLIRGNVAVYSPHTALDSAADGINESLAQKFKLRNVKPLVPIRTSREDDSLGAGRWGTISPTALSDFAGMVKNELRIDRVHVVGGMNRSLSKIAVSCGSGGSFLPAAVAAGCDALVTGEGNLHARYEAETLGIALLLAGHYATERFHLDYLAHVLAKQFPTITAWASRCEYDPGVWL